MMDWKHLSKAFWSIWHPNIPNTLLEWYMVGKYCGLYETEILKLRLNNIKNSFELSLCLQVLYSTDNYILGLAWFSDVCGILPL